MGSALMLVFSTALALATQPHLVYIRDIVPILGFRGYGYPNSPLRTLCPRSLQTLTGAQAGPAGRGQAARAAAAQRQPAGGPQPEGPAGHGAGPAHPHALHRALAGAQQEVFRPC